MRYSQPYVKLKEEILLQCADMHAPLTKGADRDGIWRVLTLELRAVHQVRSSMDISLQQRLCVHRQTL